MTERFPVLSARIPLAGRPMTRDERARLLVLDILPAPVPPVLWVSRAFDCDYIGAVYKPGAGGLLATDVSVTMRD